MFDYYKNCYMGGQLDELLASLACSPLPCSLTIFAF